MLVDKRHAELMQSASTQYMLPDVIASQGSLEILSASAIHVSINSKRLE